MTSIFLLLFLIYTRHKSSAKQQFGVVSLVIQWIYIYTGVFWGIPIFFKDLSELITATKPLFFHLLIPWIHLITSKMHLFNIVDFFAFDQKILFFLFFGYFLLSLLWSFSMMISGSVKLSVSRIIVTVSTSRSLSPSIILPLRLSRLSYEVLSRLWDQSLWLLLLSGFLLFLGFFESFSLLFG